MVRFKTNVELPQNIKDTLNTLLSTLFDFDIDIEIKKHRNKRSLDANAYYWVLASKLGGKLNISKNRVHNLALRSYGQLEILDDKLIMASIPDTEETERNLLEQEFYHLKPSDQVIQGNNGIDYRTYWMIRGSSTYSSHEMSQLIGGLIVMCQEADMTENEIMTPTEKIKLEAYGVKL